MKVLCVVLCVAFFGAACANDGFFDLNADEDTMFRGTTGTVLPQCFSVPSGMCGDGGRTIYTSDGQPSNLLAYYSFDDSVGLDSSGNANHALAPPPGVGPGHNGLGQSAAFDGSKYFQINHSPAFDGLTQMTISFWIYLLTDSIDAWRVVFRKGDDSDMTPTLMLFPDSRKFHARVTNTGSTDSKNGIDSNTGIPLRRWTHVALAINSNVLTLYINGIKDSEGLVTGTVKLNNGPWYFGKHPSTPGTGMFFDNLKFFSKPLDELEVQVEASSALPGLGPNFVRLGCKSCSMDDAIKRCASQGGYHLCRTMELNGGGLMVARAMGYLDMSSEQWSAEDEESEVKLEKLGLCCLD